MLLDDIYQKLSDDGVFDGVTWKCFKGFLPDVGDQCISLHETGGFPADTLGGENAHVTFQVFVRAGQREYEACRAKWQAAFDSLQDAAWSGTSPDVLEDYYMIQALAMGPMVFYDANQRVCMTANFRVMKAK